MCRNTSLNSTLLLNKNIKKYQPEFCCWHVCWELDSSAHLLVALMVSHNLGLTSPGKTPLFLLSLLPPASCGEVTGQEGVWETEGWCLPCLPLTFSRSVRSSVSWQRLCSCSAGGDWWTVFTSLLSPAIFRKSPPATGSPDQPGPNTRPAPATNQPTNYQQRNSFLSPPLIASNTLNNFFTS